MFLAGLSPVYTYTAPAVSTTASASYTVTEGADTLSAQLITSVVSYSVIEGADALSAKLISPLLVTYSITESSDHLSATLISGQAAIGYLAYIINIQPGNGTLYADNDNAIEVNGLMDETNAYQNSATIQVTLQDANGVNLTGQAWPLLLDYVAGSKGDYIGVINYGVNLTPGVSMTILVDIVSEGRTANSTLTIVPKIRTIQ